MTASAPARPSGLLPGAIMAGDVRSPRGGWIREARRPAGWVATGPAPQPPATLDDLWPGPDEDLCWLAGNWRILQRTDGHRFSLDDLCTAQIAARLFADGPPPRRHLDLGCGIGSVLLFTAWRFPTLQSLGVEAQELSFGMARRSIAWNGIGTRCQIRLGDLRDPAVLADVAPFDLITGTPPYFPPGTGLESGNVQRAPCRFEHRGGVEAYCETAARHLAPDAPFVVCAAPGQVARLERCAPGFGLYIEHRRDIIPKTGKAPLFSTYVLRAPHPTTPPRPFTVSTLTVRDAHGHRTDDVRVAREEMGMPP